MVDLTDKTDEKRGTFHEIKTREGALSYAEELVVNVEDARTASIEARTIKAQVKARANLMMRYGRAVGALSTLMHCRMLDGDDYSKLATRAHKALASRVVASIVS